MWLDVPSSAALFPLQTPVGEQMAAVVFSPIARIKYHCNFGLNNITSIRYHYHFS